jgi:oxygen-dependent protoporphyrinogen oxidase
MPAHAQVLIIGAGISGMVCAYSLRKSGMDAQIVEASPRSGGVIHSERRDGHLLELGPQSFSSTEQISDLCRDLQIEDELISAPPHAPRFLLLDGRLKQVPLIPPAFLTTSLFSLRTKASILRDALGRSTPPNADESVAGFTRRKFSAELLDKLVGPVVSGVHAGDPEKLSLRAAFPQIYEAERTAKSVLRGLTRAAKAAKSKNSSQQPRTLQAFRNGNETLMKALATHLGPALRTEVAVTEIRPIISAGSTHSSPKFEVSLNARGAAEQITADHLILATPTYISASLLRGFHSNFASTLGPIEYAPLAVVSLGYKIAGIGHSLDGFGFLVPRSSGLRTLGTVWNSSLFPNRAPAEHALFTSFLGGATDPHAITLSPEELVSMVHKETGPVMQIRQAPAFSKVTLYPRALPQYNLGHSERLASLQKLRAEFPNLWLAGNYMRGPSVGACVEQSLEVANEIRQRLAF